MSDVKAFIDAVGRDVNAVAVPRIEQVAHEIGSRVLNDYGPKISAFTHQLVKEIIDEQSVTVRDFATALVTELCQRYRPEVAGDLQATIVQGGLALTGRGIRLDVKRQDTGEVISSLDIPVSLTIKVDAVTVNLQDTTIKLDVIK